MTSHSPMIKTKRLLLRPFVESDLQNVFIGLSDPDVIKYYGVSFDSLEATKEQMTWFADLEKNNKGRWWAVCSLDNQSFYGAGGLNDFNATTKTAEIGFWLLPKSWGKGIMTEAMPAICDYAFTHMGIEKIEGFVETYNTNCKKAMAKLDFKLEKTMIDCEEKNGQLISLDVYVKQR